MTEKEFKVGDEVLLKSGGPPMTVERVYKDSFPNKDEFTAVTAVWFDGGDYQQYSFRSTSLMHRSPSKGAKK